MLIQMPRGPSGQQGPQNADGCSAFEAGLRRDLAGAPLVSYDAVIGGWAKRSADLFIVLLTAPMVALVVLVAFAWAKSRSMGEVFLRRACVGYGGRSFSLLSMRLERPTATITPLREPPDTRVAEASPPPVWRAIVERLPALVNVASGEMSLVGPAPLTEQDVEGLKGAKRHYLSARPGLVDVCLHVKERADPNARHKAYALSWSMLLDVALLWRAAKDVLGTRA